MNRLSVIIPVYGQHELAVLHAWACQMNRLCPYEIIVVNDGGDPGLRDMLADSVYYWTSNLLYARIEQDIPWNQPGARNLGIWLSTGDVLAIEDNDHVPTPILYEEAMALMDDPAILTVRPHRHCIMLADVKEALANDDLRRFPLIKAGSATRIVRREVIAALKGYNEDFCGAHGGDDCDVVRRMRPLGGCAVPKTGTYLRVGDGDTQTLDRKKGCGGNQRILHQIRGKPQSEGGILRFTYKVEALA